MPQRKKKRPLLGSKHAPCSCVQSALFAPFEMLVGDALLCARRGKKNGKMGFGGKAGVRGQGKGPQMQKKDETSQVGVGAHAGL